jgi:hypothetical protein
MLNKLQTFFIPQRLVFLNGGAEKGNNYPKIKEILNTRYNDAEKMQEDSVKVGKMLEAEYKKLLDEFSDNPNIERESLIRMIAEKIAGKREGDMSGGEEREKHQKLKDRIAAFLKLREAIDAENKIKNIFYKNKEALKEFSLSIFGANLRVTDFSISGRDRLLGRASSDALALVSVDEGSFQKLKSGAEIDFAYINKEGVFTKDLEFKNNGNSIEISIKNSDGSENVYIFKKLE